MHSTKFRLLMLPLILWVFVPSLLFAGDYKDKATGLKFPETIGEMKLTKVTDFEKEHPGKGAGVGVSYDHTGPRIYADVFVYNLRIKEIPTGSDNKIVHQQWKATEQDVFTLEKRGTYQDVKLVNESSRLLGTSRTSPTALQAEFSFTQDKVKKYSFLYITGYRNNFVKIRFSYPVGDQKKGEKALQKFLDEIGKMLES